jgi:F0F1-type ATP synthase assembly protein I
VPGDIDPREVGYYYALAQTGLEMVAPLGIGLWVDYQFGTAPWGVVIGAIIGFVGGTAHLIIMAQKIEERRSKDKNDT